MKAPVTIALFLLGQAAVLADTKVMLPDPERFANDDRKFLVTTTIPGDFNTPAEIVEALLTVGDKGANPKLSAPFSSRAISATSGGKDALNLDAYYRGARLHGETITVAFSSGAMRYLNNTVAIQQLVKGSIEETLRLHFPSVKTIQYEIDGKIVSGWDG